MIVKGLRKDNTSGKKQEGTLEKEEEPTDEEGKGESNVTEEKTHKSTKLEDLEEDNKKKFLKICETCWDQVFINEMINEYTNNHILSLFFFKKFN